MPDLRIGGTVAWTTNGRRATVWALGGAVYIGRPTTALIETATGWYWVPVDTLEAA